MFDADPRNTQLQADLATALVGMGNVFLKLNLTDQAREKFEDALRIRKEVAAADLDNARKQRNHLGSLEQLGDLALESNQFEDACLRYCEAIAIAERMQVAGQVVELSKDEKYRRLLYKTACLYALWAESVPPTRSTPADEAKAERSKLLESP